MAKTQGKRSVPRRKKRNLLGRLLDEASEEELRRVVEALAEENIAVRIRCLEELGKGKSVKVALREEAAGSAVEALWEELEADLGELHEFGWREDGGTVDLEEGLERLAVLLAKGSIPEEVRRRLRDEMVVFLAGGETGYDHDLYEAVLATCLGEEELRELAQCFEQRGDEATLDYARRIYRRLKDDERYLALREARLESAKDYMDLVAYHRSRCRRAKAVEVAKVGLAKTGRNGEELRDFLIGEARRRKDRAWEVELEFGRLGRSMDLGDYLRFEAFCTKEEWRVHEAELLKVVARAWSDGRMAIHLHRGEKAEALAILQRILPGHDPSHGDLDWKVTEQLEETYPAELFGLYRKALGDMDKARPAVEYKRQARILKAMHRVAAQYLKDEGLWSRIAAAVKARNSRRPRFNQACAENVPGWSLPAGPKGARGWA